MENRDKTSSLCKEKQLVFRLSDVLFYSTFVSHVYRQLDPAHKPAPQLPCDFNFYDLDRDGLVPRDEFNLATAAYQNYEMSKSYDVFSIMDVDCKLKIFHFIFNNYENWNCFSEYSSYWITFIFCEITNSDQSHGKT